MQNSYFTPLTKSFKKYFVKVLIFIWEPIACNFNKIALLQILFSKNLTPGAEQLC